MAQYEWTVLPEDAGSTVEGLLKRRLRLSKTKRKRAKFAPGGLLLDGAPVRSTAAVSPGQRLCVTVPELEAGNTIPTPGDLNIAYEDRWYLVLDKPAGLPVHPGPGHYAGTLGNRLAWHAREQGIPFVLRLVNRLDKGTSGLLVAAKSAPAQEALSALLHTEGFVRQYLAICEGEPPQAQGDVNLPLGKAPGALNEYQVLPGGLPALTHYRVVERRQGRSLLSLTLFTGRTHQIRVHMAALGCPLAGDPVYGRGGAPGRPALHSCRLAMTHPFTGEKLVFTAPLPDDLAELWGDRPDTPP